MPNTKNTGLREQRTIVEEIQKASSVTIAVELLAHWLETYNYPSDRPLNSLVMEIRGMLLFQGMKRLRFWMYDNGLEDSTDCQHVTVYRATGQCTTCGLSKENIASDEALQELRRRLRTPEEQAHEDSVSGRMRLFRNGGPAQNWEERIVELRDELRELRSGLTQKDVVSESEAYELQQQNTSRMECTE